MSKPLIWTGLVVGGVCLLAYRYLSSGYENDHESKKGGTFESVFVDDGSSSAPKKKAVKKERFVEPNKEVVPILILYGTEYGLSSEVAKKLEEEVNAIDGFWARVVDMEEFEILEFDKEQVVLIVNSTYGDGVPPTTARPFFDNMEALSNSGTNSTLFSHLQYCVLALGDSAYPYYCRAGKTMDKLFGDLGAKKIMNRVDVDQEDWSVMDPWVEKVCAKLLLKKSDLQIRSGDYLHDKVLASAANSGFNRKKPYYSKLSVRRAITQMNDGEDKETIHYDFELEDSGLTFTVGDALAIYPTNSLEEVDQILMYLASDANTASQMKINTPSWHYIEEGQEEKSTQMLLRDALAKCYDLHNLKPELLQLIRDKTKNKNDKTVLTDLLAEGTGKSNTGLQDYLYKHHLVDVFSQFKDAIPSIPLDDLLSRLSRLLPRYYSISSSLKAHPTKVSITVAVVRYTLHGSKRVGVTSTFLSDRVSEGERIPIFVNNNPDFRLPTDAQTPIVMVGPGTGLAPFRAFLQERDAQGALTNPSLNTIFFGCRHYGKDFLYREELETLHKDSKINLITAFSRDQAQKVYVQHRIEEHASFVWESLSNGGHFYVCGDANHMAGDVHKVLLQIVEKHGNMSSEEAEHYIEKLEKDKRYQKDIWF
eukprot:TRINITY_DN8344_c0_g2_i1.p1 TRINITY_DN8344_c0_g2~~TRINITY_DN8344_c0_g2_i1.p1  ORF type:complete len:649 (-),score=168.84 TRINITY_DN8344_c0_g2_i1:136-2082(-)